MILFCAALPPVRNLWVSSYFPAMNAVQVCWQNPPGPPVTRFYLQWRPETRPSIGCWITVDSWSSSALIEGLPTDPNHGFYWIAPIENIHFCRYWPQWLLRDQHDPRLRAAVRSFMVTAGQSAARRSAAGFWFFEMGHDLKCIFFKKTKQPSSLKQVYICQL